MFIPTYDVVSNQYAIDLEQHHISGRLAFASSFDMVASLGCLDCGWMIASAVNSEM
jgi:hypothetical protein